MKSESEFEKKICQVFTKYRLSRQNGAYIEILDAVDEAAKELYSKAFQASVLEASDELPNPSVLEERVDPMVVKLSDIEKLFGKVDSI